MGAGTLNDPLSRDGTFYCEHVETDPEDIKHIS